MAFCRRFLQLTPSLCANLTKTTVVTPRITQLCQQKNKYIFVQCKSFSSTPPSLKKAEERVTINFVMPGGEKKAVSAKVGDSILDVVIDEDVGIDGFGACEGTLACSTCHLIFEEKNFQVLPEKMSDEELDMLDLAYAVTESSRLGCQIVVSKSMDGWTLKVPEAVADAREV